ncbi:MAG TPA: glycosyltransferase [Vicinamibacterales bacterium]|nr:glycosyltransferase [Vicinamibacterales bacterium]
MTDRMLRVLHVFGRLLRGGAELRTVELAESFGWERVRSDFLVLSGLDGTLDDRVRAAGGEVVKCPLNVRFPTSLFRLLRSRDYDVVHSHVHYFSGVVLAIARLARTPVRVAHFRSAIANDRPDAPWRRAQLAACRWLLHRYATDILAVGEGAMAEAWRSDWRTDPRCRVVYSGIPLERLHGAGAACRRAPTIVNVGSVQPLKNQLRLVGVLQRCVREIPDAELLLVGREIGDYGQQIRRAAGAAGLAQQVHLVGEVDEPAAWIAGASLMVIPSLWEGLPGAALEACALGIPVLAADLPGTRELSRHFPQLTTMAPGAGDEAWAAAAVRLIRRGTASRRDAGEAFARSPFTIARSRETHYEIWSRSRATA